jgi:hypothetical protein
VVNRPAIIAVAVSTVVHARGCVCLADAEAFGLVLGVFYVIRRALKRHHPGALPMSLSLVLAHWQS